MIEEPQCSIRHCRHFQGIIQPAGDESDEVPVCAAFPKGIPEDISFGDNLHLEPVKGDHGIQFEQEKS